MDTATLEISRIGNVRTVLATFTPETSAAPRRLPERNRLDVFREFVRELDRDRESRAAGLGPTEYFQQPCWNFLTSGDA